MTRCIAPAAALLLVIAAAPAAGQQSVLADDTEIALQDSGPQRIAGAYVVALDAPGWGEDLVEGSPSPAEIRRRVRLPRGPCERDVRVVYWDGTEAIRYGVDLCRERAVLFGRRRDRTPPPRNGVGFFTLRNDSTAFVSVYATPAGELTPIEDVTGGQLPPGRSVTGRFSRDRCHRDFRLYYYASRDVTGGEDRVRLNVDLCAASAVAIGPPESEALPPEVVNALTIEFVNQGHQPIDFLFIREAGRDGWGNTLIASPVAPSATASIRVLRVSECRFDVRVVSGLFQESVRENVDLCASPRFAFGQAE